MKTFLDAVHELHPDKNLDSIVIYDCPSEYRLEDHARCDSRSCCECWSRPYPPPQEEVITISKKLFEAMQTAEKKLSCLEAAGVDNWSGYDYAMKLLRNSSSDEEE